MITSYTKLCGTMMFNHHIGVEYNLCFVITQLVSQVANDSLLGCSFIQAGQLPIEFRWHLIYMWKDDKAYSLQVHTQNVHNQEGKPLLDDCPTSTKFEFFLLAYDVEHD